MTRVVLAIILVDRLISADGFGLFPPRSYGISCFAEKWNTMTRATRFAGRVCPDDDADDADDADDDEAVATMAISRRRLLGRAISSSSAVVATTVCRPPIASARVVSVPASSSSTASAYATSSSSLSSSSSSSFVERRDALLRAISSKSSDDVVGHAIDELVPFGPFLKTSSSYESALDGSWKLLWYNKSDFSPLLNLPYPLRPDSYQYFGSVAVKEVGEGRAAQGLTGGVVSAIFGKESELWLSSGVVATTSTKTSASTPSSIPTTLIIYPPFRLQLGTNPLGGRGEEKRTIVESESDADFRKVNARSAEAQSAPRNEYEQLYLEDFGKGSLRVSVITKGDPVIVGDMFVHQKL